MIIDAYGGGSSKNSKISENINKKMAAEYLDYENFSFIFGNLDVEEYALVDRQ